LRKYRVKENLGQGTPDFILIVEYPSYEVAVDTFTCEKYKAIIRLRDIAFKTVKTLLMK